MKVCEASCDRIKNALALRSNPCALPRPRRILSLLPALALAFLFCTPSAIAASSPTAKPLPTLTTARQAHSLRCAEAARAYPVHLRAVVTYYEPDHGNGFAALFVNDGTGGIWVNLVANLIASLPTGSLVDVPGVSSNGLFSPIVAAPRVRVIGRSHLPRAALHLDHAHLFSGVYDSQWVQIEGIVHSYTEEEHTVILHLEMPDGSIRVNLTREAGADYSRLVDARVQIRGNAAPVFSRVKYQIIGTQLFAPGLATVKILQAAPRNPFLQPVTPIDSLMRWDGITVLQHRVHLRGTVTLFWPGSSLCLRDASGAICTQTRETAPLATGEIADVIGFAGVEGEAHILSDTVYQSIGKDRSAAPVPISADDIVHGLHDSELIQIDGQLIGRDRTSPDTTLTLKTGNIIFTAILPQALKTSKEEKWEDGSILRLTGICSVNVNAESRAVGAAPAEGVLAAKSFRLLMRSPNDVLVLQKASWWTPAHLLVVLALALAAALLALLWVAVLRKRVEEQSKVIRASEERFRQMALHDALTGLASRPLFQQQLNLAVEALRRHQTGLAILMLDIDNFKQTNDTFGHLAGDEVLCIAAQRLLQSVRKSDTVARIGGDEFVVILSSLDNPADAETIAAKIVKTMAAPVLFAERAIPVSVSVGLYMASAGEPNAETILHNADLALYQAKAHGRNCYQVFTPGLAFSESAKPANTDAS